MSSTSSYPVRWAFALGVVATLVLGLLAPVGAAAAAPAAPGSLAPNASTPAVSANPVLTWSRVQGASTYEVEVSASSSFASTVYKASTTNRRVVPTEQLPATQIWWRVRALDTARVAGPWAVASFTRSTGAGPVLASPAHETFLAQPDSPPVLRWSPVDGATSYQVEIDGAERDWVETATYSTATTSLVVPNPQENGQYWWRVRAQLGTGLHTLTSDEWSYDIGPLPVVGPEDPDDPDLTTRPLEDQVLDGVFGPEHDECESGTEDECFGDVVFDWEPVDGAVSYDIRVSTDDSFDSVIDQRVVKGTRYSPIHTYDNDDYWWQVRARDIFGKAQEWNEVRIRQFRREWSPAPTAVHPADGGPLVYGDDFYYEWSPVKLTSRYRLDVGTDANFSPTTYESCFTTQTTYAAGYTAGSPWPNPHPDKCMPSPGVTQYWRVKALDGPRSPEVQGIYSKPVRFIYDPGQVQQLAPSNGATVDVPTLSWAPASGAVKYKVVITGGPSPITKETFSYSWTPTGRTRLDPARTYTWTVQSIDRNGALSPLPLFGGRTFKVSGDMLTSGADPLEPLSPAAASAFARFPSLTWEPLDAASYYRVHVGDAGTGYFSEVSSNGFSPDEFAYPAATDTSSTHLLPGSYDWFVSAYSSTGVVLDTGPVSTFEVEDLPAVSGHRVSLDASGLDGSPCIATYPAKCEGLKGTPLLDWDPVPGAGYYMVYLSRDRQFTNMVIGKYSEPLTIPATQNTLWNPVTAIADSQAGTAYYWYVRPCKAPGVCAPDPTQANHAFEKRSNMVDRLAIADPLPGTVTRHANEITFTWRDYLATSQDPALVNAATGEPASQAARGYRVQVGTTAAFPTPLVDEVVVDQTTYTAFSKTYPEGRLFWRVQAVDGSGNGLAWSEAQEFTKESPRVVLTDRVRPLDGGTARTDQTFRWEPLRFAASYDLEVYKNDDRTASSLNRVISANSKQVAHSATTLLPVSPEPYVWRVRRVDVDGKKGAWSDWWSFRVLGDAPSLVAPANNATVAGDDALFTWRAITGAAKYRFERKQAGASYSSETVVTAALAWAPTSTIPAGTWQWRVTALDGANRLLAASVWRSFTVPTVTTPVVDTTSPYVVAKSPQVSARRRANFVAKFNEPVYNVTGRTMKLFVKGSRTPLAAKVTLSSDRKTAKLNPTRNLTPGRVYILRLTAGVKDRSGNKLKFTSWRVKAK